MMLSACQNAGISLHKPQNWSVIAEETGRGFCVRSSDTVFKHSLFRAADESRPWPAMISPVINDRYLTILQWQQVMSMFFPFQGWWIGYVTTLNIITSPYLWNLFDWQASKGIIEDQFWGNMWWVPIAMVVNLLTLPLNIISTLFGLSAELLFFPFEILLGWTTIFTWFILNPIAIDWEWWPEDKEGITGDTTAREVSEVGFVSLAIIIIPRILQFLIQGWFVNYLILPDSLPSVNALIDQTTVSGDSGGGFMAS